MEIGGVNAITSVFSATLRISQAVYELKAVGEQTRDLLDTTKHIDDSMRNVRAVRRRKSALFTTTEKEWIDGQIKNSEKAVGGVAALIEPARVDMQSKSNRTKDITFKSRVMFVLRDSPNVAVQLTKLSIATQGLNAAMAVLCQREGHASQNKVDRGTLKKSDRRSTSPSKHAPPTYELSEFMNRRRTTSSINLRQDLRHKSSRVLSVDEEYSGDEAITLSTNQSWATLRTRSSWVTTEGLVHSPDDGKADTEKEVVESASPSRNVSYLDPFDMSPACTPLLAFGDSQMPVRFEPYSELPGNDTYIDAWRLETQNARGDQQKVPTPTLKAQRSSDRLSPNSILSASLGQISLDSGVARITQSGASFSDHQSNARCEEMLPSHPPLLSYKSEPITTQMPGMYPPPVPTRPDAFQPHHLHTDSMPALHDAFLPQSLVPAPWRTAPRSPPCHPLMPQIDSNQTGTLESWGDSGRPKLIKRKQLTSTATISHCPSPDHQNRLPYPYSAPSTNQFPPPLRQVLSDPIQWRPESAHALHQSPGPDTDLPSPPTSQPDFSQPPSYRSSTPSVNASTPPYPHTDPIHQPLPRSFHPTTYPLSTPPPPPPSSAFTQTASLAETVQQDRNLLYYKPLPHIPLGRNPSVTSVAPSLLSTKSEPIPSSSSSESRISRGRMWLEHHAEQRTVTSSRESVGGPLSGGFLAPPPPPPLPTLTVRQV